MEWARNPSERQADEGLSQAKKKVKKKEGGRDPGEGQAHGGEPSKHCARTRRRVSRLPDSSLPPPARARVRERERVRMRARARERVSGGGIGDAYFCFTIATLSLRKKPIFRLKFQIKSQENIKSPTILIVFSYRPLSLKNLLPFPEGYCIKQFKIFFSFIFFIFIFFPFLLYIFIYFFFDLFIYFLFEFLFWWDTVRYREIPWDTCLLHITRYDRFDRYEFLFFWRENEIFSFFSILTFSYPLSSVFGVYIRLFWFGPLLQERECVCVHLVWRRESCCLCVWESERVTEQWSSTSQQT